MSPLISEKLVINICDHFLIFSVFCCCLFVFKGVKFSLVYVFLVVFGTRHRIEAALLPQEWSLVSAEGLVEEASWLCVLVFLYVEN